MVSLHRPTPPSPRALSLRAADGFAIGARVFEPRRPRATVVIHSATAVPQTYYAAFAEFLATRGLRVLTYDYRGIGESRPPSLRGFAATMRDWAELDVRAAHRWATEHDDDVLLIGHSFGGQILGLVDELRDVRGAMLVASQLGFYRHWPWPTSLRYSLMWRALVPAIVGAAGYLPGRAGLGVDLPGGVALEWARWCRHPEYLVGHVDGAAERFARWDRPTLLYSFTDDPFAPRRAVEALVARLAGAPLDHRRIAPRDLGADELGHFGFFRPRAARLWPDAARFLDATLLGDVRFADSAWITPEEIEEDLQFGR